MILDAKQEADVLIVRVTEARIDAAIAVQFKDAMRAESEAWNGKILLDLSAVDFLDSSGLGAVVGAMKQIGENQTLELAGLTPTVEKVFHLTRMNSVFTIHSDVEAAMAVAKAS
ncbi:MAG: STAS domain-containing protein [Pseudomonadota bacterium]